MKVKSIGLALAFAGLGVLQQITLAQALTWNWSYSTNFGDTASGQWVSDGTTYTAGNTYTISSISGKRDNVTITGLNPTAGGPDQQFTYNGTTFNPDNNGISYNINSSTSPNNFNVFNSGTAVGEVSYFNNTQVSNAPLVTSSSLSPANVPWDFSPTLGLALYVPLYIGLRIRKKRLARKSTASKATVAVS